MRDATYLSSGICPGCERRVPRNRLIGVQYSLIEPNAYDGVSEWVCPDCGLREGRWTHKILKDGESELRYGGKR